MRHQYLVIHGFMLDENGVTSIEYALIASLIAIVIIGAVTSLGDTVCERFRLVVVALGGATACP